MAKISTDMESIAAVFRDILAVMGRNEEAIGRVGEQVGRFRT